MSLNSNDPPPTNPVLDAYEKFVQDTPFVTRTILLVQAFSYVLSWFFNPQYALGNIPQFTVFSFEIYRIVLSPLVNDSLLSLILAFWSFREHGKRLESSMGSTAFAWLCLMLGCLTNIAFVVLSLLLYAVTKNEAYLIHDSSGIWIILFGTIALECFRAPRGSSRRFLFTQVSVLRYPLALYVFFAFLGQSMLLAQLLSLGWGYLLGYANSLEGAQRWPWTRSLDRTVLVNGAKAKDWEDQYLNNFSSRPGWVVSNSATGSGAWSEDDEAGINFPLFRQMAGTQASGEIPFGSADSNLPLESTIGGRPLGGATRRVVSASEARAARLNALEKRPEEKEEA